MSLATQVSILETSVIRQCLHVDGSAPVCSFTFGAHSQGLDCLSLTLALKLGNLGLWKYKSVRVRQICVRSWLRLNGGMILARSPFFQSFNFHHPCRFLKSTLSAPALIILDSRP